MYNSLDLLGDLGGVTEVIMIFFGFILTSVSEHSFYLTATSKLFFARTSDSTIFLKHKDQPKKKYLEQEFYPKDSS